MLLLKYGADPHISVLDEEKPHLLTNFKKFPKEFQNEFKDLVKIGKIKLDKDKLSKIENKQDFEWFLEPSK